MKKANIKNRMKTFSRVLKYLGHYKLLFILSVLLTLFAVALTLYVPLLVGYGIDLAIGPENVEHNKILSILYRIGIAVCLTAIFQWIVNIVNNKIAYLIAKRIRIEAFVKTL